MREIGHGTEPLRGCFQLPEPVTDLVNHLLQGWQRQIRQLFLTYVFPHVFHGIEFWAVRWLREEADIVWHQQRFGPMPACAISPLSR